MTAAFFLNSTFMIYLILLLNVLLAFFAFFSLRQQFYKFRYFGIVSLIFTILFLHLEPLGFKKHFDELDFASTAQALHFIQKPLIASNAIVESGINLVLTVDSDKRPLAYPSAVALVHTLTGYRLWNSIYLNIFLYAALIFLVCCHFDPILGRLKTLVLALSVGTIPVLVHSAGSGGYDMLNLFLIFLLFVGLCKFIESPNTTNLSLSILSGVLLAQCRAESILYLIPLGIALAVKRKYLFQKKNFWPLFFFLFLSPVAIQFFGARSYFDEGNSADGTGFFALKYLPANLSNALAYLTDTSGNYNNSLLLAIMCIGAILLLGWLYFRKQLPVLRINLPICLISLGLLLTFGVYMLLYWGDWKDSTVSRFSLPLQFFGILFLTGFILKNTSKNLTYLAGSVIVLVTLTCTLPAISKNRWNKTLYTGHQEQWWAEIIESYGDEKVLFISPSAQLAILMRKSGINIDYANENKAKIKEYLDSNRFEKIIVMETVQRTESFGKKQVQYKLLDAEFILHHINDLKFNSNADSRISELVDVKLD